MQLTFPNGEHPDVPLQGEVAVGSRPGLRVSLPGSGLATHHASFVHDRRGLWLRVPGGAPGVHLNARPVHRLAQLRAGDLVCLASLRVLVQADAQPAIERRIPAQAPAALGEAQRVSAARVVLRGLSGPHFGRSLTLTEPRTIGRSPAADIRIDDPAVAERHAVVELHGDRVVLRALSGQGDTTLLNGVPVRDAVLSPGDQLVIEQHRFVLEAPGLPPRGQEGLGKGAANPHTQTLRAVDVPVAEDPPPAARGGSPRARDPGSLWWLIAAATILAAALTMLLVYAP